MSKPSIPQGMRDFPAEVVRKRNYIFSTIKNVFETYGFEPLETPAMENLETLMGKYGEEGDRLIFKILNNGLNDPKNVGKAKAGFEKLLEGKNSADITERALKYDLTIPFARYVAMNHGKLTFPFRRYQIQPVWRADRPQKGRYREFTQCDADVVGSKSLINEAEFVSIYSKVFDQLGIDVEIRINSRKILYGLAIAIERFNLRTTGIVQPVDDKRKQGLTIIATIIATAIDKLDKIGIDGVNDELMKKGITAEQFSLISNYISIEGDNKEKIERLQSLFNDYKGIWTSDEDFIDEGINEIKSLLKLSSANSNLVIDFTLARGLNYYTGIIFEIKAKGVQIGSIGGGGRYDDLTGLFGVPDIPGVGISFGVDRIYDVMEELNLFPANLAISTKALFFNMGETESQFAFGVIQQLRNKGIACELYHEFSKITKQFNYAEKKNIPFVVIIGSKEIEQNYCLIKNLSTGLQEEVILERLFDFFNK